MDNSNIISAVEALLFIHGEPIDFKKISKILGIEEEKVFLAVKDISEALKSGNRGLSLVSQGNKIQLVTKPEFSPLIENFVKDEFEEALTPAALETLSLVAYLGPISRPKIDYFRGVNSSYTLRNLMMRGLIEKSPGSKPNLSFYQVSFDLIKHLGISKIEDLPEYDKFKSLISEKSAVAEQSDSGIRAASEFS